jgi:hypothetical protein
METARAESSSDFRNKASSNRSANENFNYTNERHREHYRDSISSEVRASGPKVGPPEVSESFIRRTLPIMDGQSRSHSNDSSRFRDSAYGSSSSRTIETSDTGILPRTRTGIISEQNYSYDDIASRIRRLDDYRKWR